MPDAPSYLINGLTSLPQFEGIRVVSYRRDPGSDDKIFRPGTIWINQTSNTAFICTSASSTGATWESAGDLEFTTDSGSALPLLGDIQILGGTGIQTSASGNTITIDSTGSSGFSWTEVTGTTQAMAVNTGYVANNAGLVTLTLPAVAVVGDVVRVSGKGAGLFSIAQNAGQQVRFLSSSSTVGVGGSVAADTQFNAIELLCITDNTTWNVLSATGSFTVT